jgi:hypothetical protein
MIGHGLPVEPPQVGASKLCAEAGTADTKAKRARARRPPAKNFLMIDIINCELTFVYKL